MRKTLEYYNNKAAEYAKDTMDLDMGDIRDKFLSYLPDDAVILDAGCGSGRDTIAFLNKGYAVDAIDGSEEMCKIATKNTGIDVKCISFEEITGTDVYDGIWACASLLHVRRSELFETLENLSELLKPDGVIYASFKYGEHERDQEGRYFNDLNEHLAELYFSKSFFILELFLNQDHRDDRSGETWINIIAKKRSF